MRERADEFCQGAILFCVVAILVWGPVEMGTTRTVDFIPVEILTALAVGLWVVRMWTQRPFRLFWPPVSWGVYAFAVYAIWRMQFAEVHFLAWREFCQVMVYALLYLVITNNLNRRESAEIVTMTLITLGMLLSVLAIYQFATHSPRISVFSWALKPAQYVNRGSGTFVNPDNFAGFVAMLIPLGLAYLLLSRMSAVAKVFLGYALVVIAAGVCVSISRGAMIALVVASALMCVALLFEGGYLVTSLVALVVILAAAVTVRSSFGAVARRFDREAAGGKVELGDRKLYWAVAAKVFEEHPWFGAGPAQLDPQSFLYRPEKLQVRMTYAHNDYLNTLADWGACGLAIIAGVLAALYWSAWNTWHGIRRKTSDIGLRLTDKGAFVLGGAFALAVAVFHCVADFDMHVPANALLAVALLALLAAHQRYLTERYWKNPGVSGKILLTIGAALAAAWLMVVGVRLANEQRWMQRADADERVLQAPLDPSLDPDEARRAPARQAAFADEIASLKKAYEADPSNEAAPYRLGEAYWSLAQQGDKGYQRDTLEAMQWYSRAILNNPLSYQAWLKYGVCLDWLDRHKEASFYFDKAGQIDPSGWYVAFCRGKHFVELDDLKNARECFYQAYTRTDGNKLPWEYMTMVDRRLAEAGAK